MCGFVAYIGAKTTAISGMDVYQFIEKKIARVLTLILFAVVLVTWNMVIYSQGSTMMHLNKIMFGETGGPIAFVITLAIIAYLYVVASNNSVLKIASAMCTLMAAIFFVNIFVVRPDAAAMAQGLVPKIPEGAATVVAGIIGGSAPGTSALWYAYSVKNQGWDKPKALNFIKYDQLIFAGMFTVFSLGIFLSGAAVLQPCRYQGLLCSGCCYRSGARGWQLCHLHLHRWLLGCRVHHHRRHEHSVLYAINSMFHISEDRTDKKVRIFSHQHPHQPHRWSPGRQRFGPAGELHGRAECGRSGYHQSAGVPYQQEVLCR